MAFAGGVGVTLNDDLTVADLFAESNGRLLVEVEPSNAAKFESTVNAVDVGTTNESSRLQIGSLVSAELAELKSAWQTPLK